MNILIKNGTILDPEKNTMREGDIFIKDGVFAEPEPSYDRTTEQIDASGCIVRDLWMRICTPSPPTFPTAQAPTLCAPLPA